MKKLLIFAAVLMIIGCTSQPYIVKEVINGRQKTQTVCTHKTYIIPWSVPGYIVQISESYGIPAR